MSNSNNEYRYSVDSNVHLDACRKRNKEKGYPVDNMCDPYITLLQHQQSWKNFPKTMYIGKKGGETLSMTCSNGYKNKPVKNVCPTGYKFRAVRNTKDGCRKYFKKCDKYDQYNFNYTQHSANPDNVDNQDHEMLSYGSPLPPRPLPPPPSQNSISNISKIENSESHNYKNNTDCKKCKKYCNN
jgi:hypothetical protein